jgi:serine/threonine protein kinase
VVDMARQALSALAHLQSQRIVHRDLKPENVLLTDAAATTLKLADFGNAVGLELAGDHASCIGKCGTTGYMAPEVLTIPGP